MDVPGTDGRAGSGDVALIAENRALRQALAERDDQLAERDNRLAELTDPGRELQAGIRLPGNCRDARSRSRPGWPNRCAGTGKRRRPAQTDRERTAGNGGKAAAEVGAAMIDCLGPVSDLTLTVTADNGREFAGHAEVSRALGADFYFARPYHSWERGLNGHTNGLVRDRVPKSTDFRKVDPADVQWVRDALNDRPRRVLGVRKPRDMFNEALAAARSKGPGAETGPDPG